VSPGPIRLPLTDRQAAALTTLLNHQLDDSFEPVLDELMALREVADNLAVLRET
jgi:hypothetical protein